ncbi:MAG: ribbon-helix-helix domain-containing protein [Phormidium tanganyikae FI6-MK23]|nr:ribbon-helix-helix domain-containing protein [Phormidium tanganyikae FI6-MK23]
MPRTRTQSQRTHKLNPKQGCKRQKSMRGIPDNPYGEVKQNVSLSLTPTALTGLDQLSQARQLSRSELIERLGQGLFALVEVPKEDSIIPLMNRNSQNQ